MRTTAVLMPLVAGVDFGTLSVRVSIVDSTTGVIGHATADYPLNRSRTDPNFATQSHSAHMSALASATRAAITQMLTQGGGTVVSVASVNPGGRKPVLVASIVAFGLFSLLTARAQAYEPLLLARFATGLGFGGAAMIRRAATLHPTFAAQRRSRQA